MNRTVIVSLTTIAVASLVIGVVLGLISLPSTRIQTTTRTIYVSTTETLALTSRNTSFNTSCLGNCSSLHLLIFNQTTLCSPYTSLFNSTFIPWSVTLSTGKNNSTKVQPPGTPLPLSGSFSGGPDLTQYDQITFLVPNGNYSYTLDPSEFRNNQSLNTGMVLVNGSDVIVDFAYYPMSCGALTLIPLKTNLTVYYDPACMIIEAFNSSCPTLDTVNQSPSLKNVTLLFYRYTAYYYGVEYSFDINFVKGTYNVWFTNSSIFCISPKYEDYRTCPLS